jgi:hypothetical protein
VHGPGRTLTHAVSVENGIIDLMHIMWRPGEGFILIKIRTINIFVMGTDE